MTSFESVSTWRQPEPPAASPARTELIEVVAGTIDRCSKGRLRVAIDGRTGAGKTSFGHELAAALRRVGRSTLRASLDDFKHPWRDAKERGYDRLSGEGYYRNAYDFASATTLLLEPSGANGSGRVVLCAHDPLTGEDHRDLSVPASADAILIVDSVFALRPEYDGYWDFRLWLDVDQAIALARGVARDLEAEGADEATRVHRDRYGAAEALYLAEVDPLSKADLIIDNNDYAIPRVVAHGEQQART